MLKNFFLVVFVITLMISCNQKDESDQNTSTTQDTSITQDTTSPSKDAFRGITKLYTVEISKALYDQIIAGLPLNRKGKKTGKLIFRFSCQNLLASEVKFDLAIYPTAKHDYEAGIEPFLAKATILISLLSLINNIFSATMNFP